MSERLLLIDTCGERPGVALSEGAVVVCQRELEHGRASAENLRAVRELMGEAGWAMTDLAAVGVVTGPGSFTGVRTGLAAAKGFCEAAGLPLAAVSRLEVLAGGEDALAVLDAGRGQFYVRDSRAGRERLCGSDSLREAAFERRVLVAEEKLRATLAAVVAEGMLEVRPLRVGDALPAVLREVRAGGADAALVEANYVREERDIYPSAKQL